MPGRVIEIDRTIRDIAKPIPPLRIGQVGNERVRLQKVVNIRRRRTFSRYKHALRHAVTSARISHTWMPIILTP